MADTIRLTIRSEVRSGGAIVTCENTGATTQYDHGAYALEEVAREHFTKGYDAQYWLYRLVGSAPLGLAVEVHNRADLRDALAEEWRGHAQPGTCRGECNEHGV